MQPFSPSEPARSLAHLHRQLDSWHDATFPGHALRPIPGGGQGRRPRRMLVFINPTIRNASSAPDWPGLRYPFVGTKPLWRILYRAGWLPVDLMQRIEGARGWDKALTRRMHAWLVSEDLYLTNLVKRSGFDAALPDAMLVRLFLPYLLHEIRLVQPQQLISFGLQPFAALSDHKLKLADHHAAAMASGSVASYPASPALGMPGLQVTPVHFPIGRGNPRQAIDLLQLLKGPGDAAL